MKTILFFLPIFILIVLNGCADEPKNIGSSLVDTNNMFAFAETTFTSVRDTSFLTPIVTGYGASNLVGRLDGNEEVVSLFNFIPHVALDSLIGASLDTVEFSLVVNYRLKAYQMPIEFEVYEVKQSWSQGTITSDTLISYDPKLLGTFSDSMNYGQLVKINLDTNAVRSWINDNFDTTSRRFYGLALRPKTGVNPGIIGFTTFSDGSGIYPTLQIKYTTKYGTFDSISFVYGEDAYVGKYNILPTSYPFEVKAGFAVRSKLIFDPSFITNKPIINRAKLTLVVDTDTTKTIKGGYSPDSLLMFFGLENDTIPNYYSTNYYAYGVLNNDTTIGQQSYTFEATTLFQLWINNLYSNQGLIIRWADETNANEKVVFHQSNDPDPAKRPSVKITYSTK
jgi:hypothetical protein